MKRLVVTADDFGLAAEVNEAIEQAHNHGILSAASLMVGARAAADAVARARLMPRLRVGLHLALVESWPVAPLANIPDLVDRTGRLRSDLAAYSFSILTRPAVRHQMRTEIIAQFEAFRATGLPLDHVNAHQHFHLHPTILAELMDIGRVYGMSALRVPFEPPPVLRHVERTLRSIVTTVVRPFVELMKTRANSAGLVVADRVFGLAWSGAMTENRLVRLIEKLPAGQTEIYTHPATAKNFHGSALGYQYVEELAALLSPLCRDALRRSGAILGGYSDLARIIHPTLADAA